MAEAFTNRQLGDMLKELKGDIKEGFSGVHNRQDIANGRTGKLEDKILVLETKQVATKWIYRTLITVIFGICSWLIIDYITFTRNLTATIRNEINLNNAKQFETYNK